jgi:hypothetical protein
MWDFRFLISYFSSFPFVSGNKPGENQGFKYHSDFIDQRITLLGRLTVYVLHAVTGHGLTPIALP